MSLEMIVAGVLRVVTPLGPRYIKPSMAQRVHLFWIFRHFQILPWEVLTPGQRRFMDALCMQSRSVPLTRANGLDAPLVGTLEKSQLSDSALETKEMPARRPGRKISDVIAHFTPASYNAHHRS
jgi:hypothetical protein